MTEDQTEIETTLRQIGTLAEMIGTTRSRVSQFMNKFRRLGLISYSGTIEVHASLLDVVLNDRRHDAPDGPEPSWQARPAHRLTR